jgi:hypothetical protein
VPTHSLSPNQCPWKDPLCSVDGTEDEMTWAPGKQGPIEGVQSSLHTDFRPVLSTRESPNSNNTDDPSDGGGGDDRRARIYAPIEGAPVLRQSGVRCSESWDEQLYSLAGLLSISLLASSASLPRSRPSWNTLSIGLCHLAALSNLLPGGDP